MAADRTSRDEYRDHTLRQLDQCVRDGHATPETLRALLIWTTVWSTSAQAIQYFQRHMCDEALLPRLIDIALEGEDAGDAPWAAAHLIEMYPADMLRVIEPKLHLLSREPWSYLSGPAWAALEKLKTTP
jgi:hypothetical protein